MTHNHSMVKALGTMGDQKVVEGCHAELSAITSIIGTVCRDVCIEGYVPSPTSRLICKRRKDREGSHGRGESCCTASTSDTGYVGSTDAEAAQETFADQTVKGGSEERLALVSTCRNEGREVHGDKMNTPQQVSTDERLVKATLSGDEEAFAELVRRYKQKIFRLSARFVRDSDELDDICQEAFIKAYQSLNKFRGDAPFEHWLTKIAVNVCYDVLRKQSRRRYDVSLDSVAFSLGDPSPADNLSGQEAWDVLRPAMTKLRPEDRLVITLLNLEEKTVRETALLTGWSEANVKVRAFRARKELKRIMGGNDGK
jgi:RNA polymerase sigma-70 factor (ECF subfamily)